MVVGVDEEGVGGREEEEECMAVVSLRRRAWRRGQGRGCGSVRVSTVTRNEVDERGVTDVIDRQ